MRTIKDVYLARFPSEIAHYIVSEFIHTLPLDECVRDYGATPEFVISRPDSKKVSPTRILKLACRHGHLALAKLMIEKCAYLEQGLVEACRHGHVALAKLMIANGAIRVNRGLHEACRGGHVSLVKLMIAHGAHQLNRGLYAIGPYNREAIANLLIKNGASERLWDEEVRDEHEHY